MVLSTAPLCCLFLLGVVCLTTAFPTLVQDDGDTAVVAAKFLYESLSPQEARVQLSWLVPQPAQQFLPCCDCCTVDYESNIQTNQCQECLCGSCVPNNFFNWQDI